MEEMKKKKVLVSQIPINEIDIINPRGRNKKKFNIIVNNIKKLGLKKPITITPKDEINSDKKYNLVCGQGRLEAYIRENQEVVPAIVVDVTKEEGFLMSLVENLARRNPSPIEQVKEIDSLDKRGYEINEIAAKTDLNPTYVKNVLRLYELGEESLIEAVELGKIPINIAMKIITLKDTEDQKELFEAYERKEISSTVLMNIKKILNKRQELGKEIACSIGDIGTGRISSKELVKTYKAETEKQSRLIKKARFVESNLLLIVTAFKKLFKDDLFIELLRGESLDEMPEYLAKKVLSKEI